MSEQTWLTRVTPNQAAFSYRDWVEQGGLDLYRQHQLLWKLFDLPPKLPNAPAPFLFRSEQHERLPRFYVLSHMVPMDRSGKWLIEPVKYQPLLESGDRLTFKLRANPVVRKPGGLVLDENGQPKQRVSGARTGQAKHKITRHDVVMEAKRRMGWKELSQDERPDLAHVIQEVASNWLLDRSDSIGCQIDHDSLRVDGHTVHRLQGERHLKDGKAICLSTVDFDGVLEVLDPLRFLSALYSGVGPAKAFGCGLLLVRRMQ